MVSKHSLTAFGLSSSFWLIKNDSCVFLMQKAFSAPNPTPCSLHDLSWDLFPNSSLSRCLMISEGKRVTGHVHQLSAESPRTAPALLVSKAKLGALPTSWPHGFQFYSLQSFLQWVSSAYKPNIFFAVGTTLSPEELEVCGLWIQSWPGCGPAIHAVTHWRSHQPPRAASRDMGTRGC